MRRGREVRRAARRLVRLSLRDGCLDAERARVVLDRYRAAKPRDLLPVLEAYRSLLRLELARREVVVESAVDLDDAMRDEIGRVIDRRYGGALEKRFLRNPTLIGGVRIRVGSDIWDGSVLGRLGVLRREFLEGRN